MPRVTFTDPEVAAVGLTEQQGAARGHDVACHRKDLRQLGKARATGDEDGFVKVVLDRPTGKLLGGTIVAPHGGDMLAASYDAAARGGGATGRAASDDVRAPDAVGGREDRRARRVQEAWAGLNEPASPGASRN